MVSREAYGAINGALVAPMNVMQAIAPLIAAWIWSATGGYDAVMVAIGAGAVSLCIGFWTAAVLSRRPWFHQLCQERSPPPMGPGDRPAIGCGSRTGRRSRLPIGVNQDRAVGKMVGSQWQAFGG